MHFVPAAKRLYITVPLIDLHVACSKCYAILLGSPRRPTLLPYICMYFTFIPITKFIEFLVQFRCLLEVLFVLFGSQLCKYM